MDDSISGACSGAGGPVVYLLFHPFREEKGTEYPGVGHDSWGNAYRDCTMLRWLFAQRRGA